MTDERRSGLKLVHWLLIAVLVALSINACFYIAYFASHLQGDKPSSSDRLKLIAELNKLPTFRRTPDARGEAMIEISQARGKLRRWREQGDALNRLFDEARRDLHEMPQQDQSLGNIIPL